MKKILFLFITIMFQTILGVNGYCTGDPLMIDCRADFITGRLWKGQQIEEKDIANLLQDIKEFRKNSKITRIQTDFETNDVKTLLEGISTIFVEISTMRREDDKFKDSINSFVNSLRNVSEKVDLETIKEMVSIIMNKYAGY